MLGEAAEKLGFKARGEERGVGAQTAAPVDAGAAAAKEDVPAVTALRNRAGESRSPYVSCAVARRLRWRIGTRLTN